MSQPQRLRGDRSVLSTVFGRFAPTKPRMTESVKIADRLDEVLAQPSIDKRTDKVYGLWNRAGQRDQQKTQDALSAADTMRGLDLDLQQIDRRYAFVFVCLALTLIGALVWLLP
jgi:hypothetical protein